MQGTSNEAEMMMMMIHLTYVAQRFQSVLITQSEDNVERFFCVTLQDI